VFGKQTRIIKVLIANFLLNCLTMLSGTRNHS